MKYLVQNKKEFAISVGVFVMTVINIAKAIMSKEITEELIVAFVLALFTILGWFYNMPTSKQNCEHTGVMRLEKEQEKGIITGEDFTDEAEEIEED